MTGAMDPGSKLAAVAVSSATRTPGMRLIWTSSAGMAPSPSIIRSLDLRQPGRVGRDLRLQLGPPQP